MQPIGYIEILFRIGLFIVADMGMSKYLPLALYGTRDLYMIPDFFVKRVGCIVVLTFLSTGPPDNFIQWLFRKPKENVKSQEEGNTKVD